jgi:chromosome segregation ATPase
LESETKRARDLESQLKTKVEELAHETAEVAKLKAYIESMNDAHASEVSQLKSNAEQLASDAKQQLSDMEANLTNASDKRAADLKASHDAKVAELDAEIADLKSKLTTSDTRAKYVLFKSLPLPFILQSSSIIDMTL